METVTLYGLSLCSFRTVNASYNSCNNSSFFFSVISASNLKGKLVTDFVDFIKETGTKNFGLNIDFSVFRTEFKEGEWVDPNYTPNKPEDIIPLLPYVYCCHAKFINMSDEFQETTIPYPEIIKVLQENGYEGYLLSEYEGADKYDEGYEVGQTLRKQHIMLKNLLGD